MRGTKNMKTMTLTLTPDEARAVGYACRELSFRRLEQALDARNAKREFDALDLQRCAKMYNDVAQRIVNLTLSQPPVRARHNKG